MGLVHLLEPPAKQPPKSSFPALLLPLPHPGTPPHSPHLSLASMLLAAPVAIPRPQGTVWGLMWRMSIRWWNPSTTGASPAAGLLRHSPSGLKSLHAHRSALHLSHFQCTKTVHFRLVVFSNALQACCVKRNCTLQLVCCYMIMLSDRCYADPMLADECQQACLHDDQCQQAAVCLHVQAAMLGVVGLCLLVFKAAGAAGCVEWPRSNVLRI